MEFVNEIPKDEAEVPVIGKPSSLEIGYVRFTSPDIKFELKDIKVTDVQTLRDFLWELVDEMDKNEGHNR
tara:strand:- start:891 stop:1100 length:210 start_codon:yes stop_codon:yes gene_type:complete